MTVCNINFKDRKLENKAEQQSNKTKQCNIFKVIGFAGRRFMM